MEHIKGRVILASGSPRRKQILEEQFGFKDVQVVPSGFPENLPHQAYAPFEYPIATATQKALDVYRSEADADVCPELLLAADTVVELNGIILEKPRGFDHHVAMLQQLRDIGPHRVYTGVVAIVPFEKPVLPGYALDSALGVSEVTFRKDITDEEIIEYVSTKEGADAAGGYKIQEKGAKFVEKVTGDKFNVVGLPVAETKRLINKVWEEAMEENDEIDDHDDEGSEDEATYF